ncbi:hypothetical protein DPMN_126667 [Dreissena polymorpha]|uniref:Uncharacterized protein n=1 Tax=Dreissena polymorpha TaxID=45954 RepID=A0A9D4GWH2_DREPO|nr:hypothetical protein DPMN_126667 [Dreissena polymorpha]
MFYDIGFWADIQLGYNLIFAGKVKIPEPTMTNRALWAGPWEADAYSHAACLTQGAPQGLVMRPCMVEIDRIVIRDFECLTGYCKPSWRAGGLCGLFQGSMARTDGQTDGGDNHNEPVNSQLTLPTKHKLYVSGCGTIYTNCIRNNKTLRV